MFDCRSLALATAVVAWAAVAQSQTESQPNNEPGALSAQQNGAQPTPSSQTLTQEQITKAVADGVNAAAKEYEARHPTPPPDNSGWWFNFWLVIFTGGLLVVGAGQCYLIFWTLQATEKAAKAAENAANAAVQIELPILSVVNLMLATPNGASLSGGVPPETTRFGMSFKNSGRTTATLIDQCIERAVTSALPNVPLYEHVFPFSPGTLVEASKPSPATIQNYLIHLTEEQRKAIEKDEQSLWVYGYIAFRDFTGDRHEHRYCARWVPFKSGIADTPTGFVYSSDTPSEYTRST